MTVAEFLDWAGDGTGTRWELIAGAPVAMALPRDVDSVLAGIVAGELHARLKRPCRIRIEGGIIPGRRNDAYLQPDIAIGCKPPSDQPGTAEPLVVVEVLSPFTERDDRGVKLTLYRQVE